MYFHCQTNLIRTFRARFPDDFEFEGNRSIVFTANARIPVGPLSSCIADALTYHRTKTGRRGPASDRPRDRARARVTTGRSHRDRRDTGSS